MGVPKALLEADAEETFLDRLAAIFRAAGLRPLVVLGAHAPQIQAAHPNLASVLNPRWREGQLSSVFVGLRAALAQGAQQILIHPVDTPMIASSTAARVLFALEQSAMAVAHWEGARGHPLGLQASAARTLLASGITTLEEGTVLLDARPIAVGDPSILDNLNSPEAYLGRFGRVATAASTATRGR